MRLLSSTNSRPPQGGGRPHRSGRRAARVGFTLLELLVAMAVLAILLVFLTQMVGSVSNLYSQGKARSEANGVGRTLLDTVTGDLRQAIIRPDLATFVEQDTESLRALKFYCLRTGDFRGTSPATNGLDAARAASIVEYVFYRKGSKQGYFARRDRPCSWSSSTAVVPLGQKTSIQSPNAITEESLIYEGVVGVDWSYLRADGSMTNRLASGNTSPLVAIRFSLAVLDGEGMSLLKKMNQVGEYIQIFTQPGQRGITAWESQLQTKAPGFPSKVISGTRFYERLVTLPQSVP